MSQETRNRFLAKAFLVSLSGGFGVTMILGGYEVFRNYGGAEGVAGLLFGLALGAAGLVGAWQVMGDD